MTTFLFWITRGTRTCRLKLLLIWSTHPIIRTMIYDMIWYMINLTFVCLTVTGLTMVTKSSTDCNVTEHIDKTHVKHRQPFWQHIHLENMLQITRTQANWEKTFTNLTTHIWINALQIGKHNQIQKCWKHNKYILKTTETNTTSNTALLQL